MKLKTTSSGTNIYSSILFCTFLSLLILPALAFASEGSAQFFVSAYLVRLWLALLGGTAIISGVILAMNGYSKEHTLEPSLTEESKVTINKIRKLSYRKIGGGLLCVIFGCAFFVTAVFLLPDKRTGHSGLSKIGTYFSAAQSSTDATGKHDDSKEAQH